MINIVIPMAGRGSRFSEVGFELPKPLIPVHEIPMVRLVIENIKPICPHRFIFICQEEHRLRYDLADKLQDWAPGCKIIFINKVTAGAACTVLLAEEYIDNDSELMIANSDQWIDLDINEYLSIQHRDSLDGLIMTMGASDPKWSYVGFNDCGDVSCVVEKEVISNEATVGIYNFRKGSQFCAAAKRMINQKKTVNGEYYVAPVYNELIENSLKIGTHNIGSVGSGMYGLGTPADLEKFLGYEVSKKASNIE